MTDDLINRQNEQIEKLEKVERFATKTIEKQEAEIERVIKEYAARLKKVKVYSSERNESVVPVAQIDWVGQWFIKEMTEQRKEDENADR